MHILVVDDEPAIGQLLASYLSRNGHTVKSAETGEAALELIAEPFDLAVVDFSLPDMNGMEVATEYLERTSARVILASGYDIGMDLVPAAFRPRVRSIRKPFMPRAILAAFADTLSELS